MFMRRIVLLLSALLVFAITLGTQRSAAFFDCCGYPGGPECPAYPPSPILIGIDNQNLTLTSPEAGVVFDILGDGNPIQISWTPAGSQIAFLALDRAMGRLTAGKSCLA